MRGPLNPDSIRKLAAQDEENNLTTSAATLNTLADALERIEKLEKTIQDIKEAGYNAAEFGNRLGF